MAQTYTRQSSFADGDTITAALFNDEYNQLVNAFAYSSSSASSTGHRHDGSAAQGGNIFKIGDLDFLNKIEVDSSNNRWGFYVEVSAAAVEQIRIQDGAIVPVTDSDIDLGTTSLRFKDTFTDSITTTGNVDVGGNLTVTGTTTFNGGTITMGDAANDNVVFGADVNSNIIPNTDNTYDLGSSSQEWKDLYVDGVAYLDGINFNGTAITSTAAELNILDGVTSTAAELNILDGVTSTTAELNILDGVTSTAAELNILDGVTATAAELNILDGVTSTTAELNILDGVTATAAELNALDGITATVSELNILDGVTASAADINLIDGITNGTVIASKAIITDANKDITGGRNITITGELDAATLDISGDADIDGTLEADAITINGVTLAETISDTVGAMVTSNTETGIAVTYDDSDNTLDFVIGTLNQDTTGNAATATALETARTIHGVSFDGTANIDLSEVIQDTVGAMVSSNTESGITVAYEDSDGTLDFTVGTLNQDTTGNAATATALETARTIHGVSFDGTANIDLTEVVQDTVGAMFSSNTETGITATYQDSDGTIDLTVSGAAVTNIADTDGDTKVQVEESSDEDTIRFDTAGTERMVITSGGDVAIGSATADPLGLTFTGTGLTINEDSGTTFIQLDGGNGSRIEFGQSGSRHFSLFSDASNFTEFKRTTDHPIVFAVNSAETARFTSGALQFAAGKNITNASGDLTIDVAGDITLDADGGDFKFADGGTDIGQFINSSSDFKIRSVVQDKDLIFEGNDGGATITALTLDMSEAGEATFNSHINLPDSAKIKLGAGDDLQIYHDGSNSVIADEGTGGLFLRGTNTVDIQSALGHNYIKSTISAGTQIYFNNSEKFATVTGGIKVTGNIENASGDMTIDVAGDLDLDVDGEHIRFKDDGTEIGNIDMGSQNLGIRSKVSDKDIIFLGNDGGSEITALTLDMSAAGAATFNDNVTAYSDKRLKDNIETIENGLDKVEQLRGVTYTRDEKESIGVIAQEVEKILPEIVLTADDEMGTKSVDYSRLTAVLIEAVKELSARVKELENK